MKGAYQMNTTADKRTYTVLEIAAMLDISKSTAYTLVRQEPFKTVKIGSTIRVSKPSFDTWLDAQS